MSANAPSLENVCNGHTILTRNIVRDTGGIPVTGLQPSGSLKLPHMLQSDCTIYWRRNKEGSNEWPIIPMTCVCRMCTQAQGLAGGGSKGLHVMCGTFYYYLIAWAKYSSTCSRTYTITIVLCNQLLLFIWCMGLIHMSTGMWSGSLWLVWMSPNDRWISLWECGGERSSSQHSSGTGRDVMIGVSGGQEAAFHMRGSSGLMNGGGSADAVI